MFKAASFATLALALSLATVTGAAPSSNDNPLCYLPQYCTPEQVINCMKSVVFEQAYYKSVIDDIITLLDPYVFTDILKNPPQPEGFTDYFKPVDLIAELRKINTNPATFYEFYCSIKRVLNLAQDGHLSYIFDGSDKYDHDLLEFYWTLPLALHGVDDSGEAKMVGKPVDAMMYSHFRNGAEVQATVSRNVNVPIASINGMAPFDFVLSFGSEYYNFLKNRDAKYTYAAYFFQYKMPLSNTPLEARDFMDFEVVYENGDNFTTDFLFLNSDPYDNGNNNNKMRFTEYVRRRVSEGTALRGGQLDLVKLHEEWEGKGASPAANEPGTWDYSADYGVLKCRVDAANGVNVYYASSFLIDEDEDYARVLTNCVKLFGRNEYPTIVISHRNVGGDVVLANILQEAIQPDMVTREYASYKDSQMLRRADDDADFYEDLEVMEGCRSVRSAGELFRSVATDDYGNGTTHRRSAPHTVEQLETDETVRGVRAASGRPRKPTEIVVFTDSFSFGAGAFLTKGLREAGAAIIAGYGGYPGSARETFDIGQSPTVPLQDDMDDLDEATYKRLKRNGVICASVSIGETFRVRDVQMRANITGPLIPREFLVDAPDERVNVYDYDYDRLVAAGLAILEKYKTECNPANPRLHLRNASCDEAINKNHMHGGFTCGADGKWSTVCEGYYCDYGFVYDAGTDSCILDVCYEEASRVKDSLSTGAIVGITLIVLIIVVAAVVLLVFFYMKYKNKGYTPLGGEGSENCCYTKVNKLMRDLGLSIN